MKALHRMQRLVCLPLAGLAFLASGCEVTLEGFADITMQVIDMSTGEVIADAKVAFAAVPELGDRPPDEIISGGGGTIEQTDSRGEFQVAVPTTLTGFLFVPRAPRVVNAVWIVSVEWEGNHEIVLVTPREDRMLDEGELAYLGDHLGGIGETIQVTVTATSGRQGYSGG